MLVEGQDLGFYIRSVLEGIKQEVNRFNRHCDILRCYYPEEVTIRHGGVEFVLKFTHTL